VYFSRNKHSWGTYFFYFQVESISWTYKQQAKINVKVRLSLCVTNKTLTIWSSALLEKPLSNFPAFHRTRGFNTEFTRALHLFLSWARPIQSTSPHPTSPRSILSGLRLCLILVRNLFVYDGSLSPRPTPKLEDHPLSFVCGYVFNIFAANLNSWRPFFSPQPEDGPCCGDRDPPNKTLHKEAV
jgi:hypothetical protein